MNSSENFSTDSSFPTGNHKRLAYKIRKAFFLGLSLEFLYFKRHQHVNGSSGRFSL